jgi:alkylation response protein AidB-like acyl-CoA dehydrogenase
MDFDLNSEQQQLADAIARWAEKDYNFEKRKQIISADAGVSSAAWQALAELGVLALPVPSEHDGFDGTAIDQMVVMQALGRALVVEPVFATALGVQFLKLAGGHGEVLTRIAGGEMVLACALGERQSRHDDRILITLCPVSGSRQVEILLLSDFEGSKVLQNSIALRNPGKTGGNNGSGPSLVEKAHRTP